jgi:hypothetical protein
MAENMNYETLKESTDGYFCRLWPDDQEPIVTNANTPPGMFSPLLMPVDDLGPNENPLVHLVDMIPDYQEAIDRVALTKEYKAWFKDKDWSKLSPPFGLKDGRLLHVRAFGLSRRGDHTRTVVYMMPHYTTPAGGKTRPESTAETEPLMQRHMRNPKKVIWHTDGARCYRHHENNTRVKHAKRIYACAGKLQLSNGDVLMCYGGTQLQDGLWKHLGDHIPKNMNTGSGEQQKQLAKWVAYWAWRFHRASCLDMFAELGATVAAVRKDQDCERNGASSPCVRPVSMLKRINC